MSLDFASSVPIENSSRHRQLERWKKAGRRTVSLSAEQYKHLARMAEDAGEGMSEYVARNLGLPKAPARAGQSKKNKEERREIARALMSGRPAHVVASMYGIAETTVRVYARKEYGYSTGRTGRPRNDK